MNITTNEKVIEIRNKIAAGMWKWQFGNDRTAISIDAVVNDVVKFYDGHQDSSRRIIFEMTVNEFSIYLVKNCARQHWTIGA